MKKAGFLFIAFVITLAYPLLSFSSVASPNTIQLTELAGLAQPLPDTPNTSFITNNTSPNFDSTVSDTVTAPPMVAVGQYNNGISIFPLLLNSRDGGTSWSYRIQSDFPTLPINFENGQFTAASCSGLHCVAIGVYGYGGSHVGYPLYAYSSDGGFTWVYADSNPSLLPVDFVSAQFTSLSCSGLNCVAAGFYENDTYSSPFLARSIDGGVNWTYPLSNVIFVQNLPFGFNGAFSSVSCLEATCVAGGYYNALPFLAQSSDGGATWIFFTGLLIQNLPSDLVVGTFNSVSCSGLTCVAAGNYAIVDQNITNQSSLGFPLLAMSSNGGKSWSYVINRTVPFLPTDFNQGKLLSASCSDLTCVVGGFYNDVNAHAHPLLAVSQDKGVNWLYTIDSNISSLPVDFVAGQFSSVSCFGLNCVAAGNYQNNSNTSPLLANSINGGITWVYAINSSNPLLPQDFSHGELIAASCSGLYCIVAGSYNNGMASYPLLAESRDGGLTWVYAVDSMTPALPADFMSGGFTASDVSVGFLFGIF